MAGPRRASVRTRLTLVYGVTFAAVSSALVVATYLLVRQRMTAEFQRLNGFDLKGKSGVDLPPEKVIDYDSEGSPITVADLKTRITDEQQQALEATTRSLLDISVATAVGGGLIVLAVCWLMSGRVIRPLQLIGDTAESIAGSSLYRRIRMTGPDDELKRLADTFDAMLDRLDHSFDGQRAFVGNASHELRTPLAVSRTLIQVAMDRPGASPDLVQLGTTLLEINTEQARLTDALLTLARSEQELTDMRPVDLATVCQGVLDHRRAEAEQSDVEVTSEIRSVVVPGEATLLTRLVDNLVANAIAHNRPGGTLRIVVAATDETAVLSVENTGDALDPDAVAGLFEPFRRLGPQRIGTSPGFGLGLSIVRAITHAHRGQVTAVPRPGGGLVVQVALRR